MAEHGRKLHQCILMSASLFFLFIGASDVVFAILSNHIIWGSIAQDIIVVLVALYGISVSGARNPRTVRTFTFVLALFFFCWVIMLAAVIVLLVIYEGDDHNVSWGFWIAFSCVNGIMLLCCVSALGAAKSLRRSLELIIN